MKKNIVFMVLVLSFVGFASAAKKRKVVKTAPETTESKSAVKLEDAAASQKKTTSAAFQAWLKEMKKRIQRTTTRSNQLVAVAAVRGDETPDAPPLYWKGKKSEGNVAGQEARDFEAAIDTALTGDPATAKEKLNSFLMAYPKSNIAPDAQETLSRLDASSVAP